MLVRDAITSQRLWFGERSEVVHEVLLPHFQLIT